MRTKRQSSNKKSAEALWQHSTTLRWHWEVRLKRKDGSTYRKAGNSADKARAAEGYRIALERFSENEGRGGNWTIQTWGEYVAEKIWPKELAGTTQMCYASTLGKHVYPKIGSIRLDSLTITKLREWLDDLVESTSTPVARSAKFVLGSILTRAVQDGLITTNLMHNVKMKTGRRVVADSLEDESEGKVILSAEQRKALTEASKGNGLEWIVFLGLNFGLRLGESCGLQWSDIDLDNRALRVRRQAQYISGKARGKSVGRVELVPTKSEHGKRSIPIPSRLVPTLTAAKAESNSIFVAPNEDGGVFNSRAIASKFQALCLKAGFVRDEHGNGLPTTHDLRSTWASILANDANNGLGINPYTLMRLLGHGTLDMATKHYVRTRTDDLEKAMEAMEATG